MYIFSVRHISMVTLLLDTSAERAREPAGFDNLYHLPDSHLQRATVSTSRILPLSGKDFGYRRFTTQARSALHRY